MEAYNLYQIATVEGYLEPHLSDELDFKKEMKLSMDEYSVDLYFSKPYCDYKFNIKTHGDELFGKDGLIRVEPEYPDSNELGFYRIYLKIPDECDCCWHRRLDYLESIKRILSDMLFMDVIEDYNVKHDI